MFINYFTREEFEVDNIINVHAEKVRCLIQNLEAYDFRDIDIQTMLLHKGQFHNVIS